MRLPSKRKLRRIRRRRLIRAIRFVKSLVVRNTKYGRKELSLMLEYYECRGEDFYFACRFLSFTDERFSIIENVLSTKHKIMEKKLTWKL